MGYLKKPKDRSPVNTEKFNRKLTAIFSADVEGYSRLMRDDEDETIHTITTYRLAIAKLVQKYRGRVVDSPGDNILAEFGSVLDAVNCAVEAQRELAERNEKLPENRKMRFRIGVNSGDVVEEGERIYGDGVNIASRIEGLAEGGGICVSGTVYDSIEGKLGLEFENLGEHEVKNIDKLIRIFRVLSFLEAPAQRSVEPASVEKMAFPLPDNPSIAVLPFDNMSGELRAGAFLRRPHRRYHHRPFQPSKDVCDCPQFVVCLQRQLSENQTGV